MNNNLSIRIDQDLAKLIKEAVQRTGRSKSDLIRDAIFRQLSIESFQQLRKNLLPYGEAQGWLTDEDVFQEIS